MSDRNKRIIAVVAGLSAVALLLGLTLFLKEGGWFDGPASSSVLGWTLPFGSIVVIGALAWLLMPSSRGDGPPGPPQYVPCVRCGRSIQSEWRLCPYCGFVRDESPEFEGSSDGA